MEMEGGERKMAKKMGDKDFQYRMFFCLLLLLHGEDRLRNVQKLLYHLIKNRENLYKLILYK